MNRLDVYTAVHKMQRARLFELTVEAGKTDPADPVAAGHLASAVRCLAAELIAHGKHEERFIHPLLRVQAPRLADALDADHSELETQLDHLRSVAATHAATPEDPNLLYRALATFTATYLDHLGIEEDDALPALWEGCNDEDLAGILVAFKDSRSQLENLTSLLAQLPTLNPIEMTRMTAVGLPGADAEIAELLASLLDPRQLGALRALPPGDTATSATAASFPEVMTALGRATVRNT